MTTLALLFRLCIVRAAPIGLIGAALYGLSVWEASGNGALGVAVGVAGALSILLACGLGAVLCQIADDIAALRDLAEKDVTRHKPKQRSEPPVKKANWRDMEPMRPAK